MRRFITTMTYGFLFVLLLCSLPTAIAENSKPNILFILADDVGYEGLNCYGGESYPTPQLDALASDGIQAMHCYSMPVCHPTRISLLTGCYPKDIGSPKWGSFPKSFEKKTIANALKSSGYTTAVAGKWQLALLKDDPEQPFRLGFDDFCVFGWHEGPRYHDPMIYENGSVRSGTKGKFGPDLYREFLEGHMVNAQKKNKPFFAFYSMALCHDVTDDLKKPVPVSPSGKYLDYREMVVEMDRQVGLLVDFLKKEGLRKNTLLVFVADNGTPSRFIAYPDGNKLIKEPIFSILNGKKIHPNVTAIVVPGSQKVLAQAEAEGLHHIFKAAGVQWRNAGCSMCLAMNPDKLMGSQVCASSSNRNFIGRQGSPTGKTLLMSPAMVAFAAIQGHISDVRKALIS